MNELLIAVKSCKAHQSEGYHDIILKTWGQGIGTADLRFFTGEAPCLKLNPGPEEVHLAVPDDYISLPFKTKAILEWSVKNNYAFTFLCDVDTYLVPHRLVRTGYEKFDYSGRFGAMPEIGTTFRYRDKFGDYPTCHPWASGGVGYFLSKRAAEIIITKEPNVWAEDMWVGQVLGPYVQDGEIRASDLQIECDSAWHFPRRSYKNQSYDPKFGWMEKMYESYT